jgi:UDP-perosamine 4-acetyltransferase
MPSADVPRVVVLGGGGHARVVIEVMRAQGTALPYAVLDTNPALWGREALGVPIRGDDALMVELIREGVTHAIVGLGSVGDNRPRRRLHALAQQYGLQLLTAIHPSAICSSSASIGRGTLVCPMAVVNAAAVVGANVILNTGAIIEHDCAIGDDAHVATGARLASGVFIGSLAHIGAGATIRQQLVIGEGAIVGAGAVVVKDVKPWTVVMGVPAHLARRVPEAEMESQRRKG